MKTLLKALVKYDNAMDSMSDSMHELCGMGQDLAEAIADHLDIKSVCDALQQSGHACGYPDCDCEHRKLMKRWRQEPTPEEHLKFDAERTDEIVDKSFKGNR